MEVVVNRGSYEEIEETFIDLCYLVVNGSDDLGIPEHICPGIANNLPAPCKYTIPNCHCC